MDDFQYRDGELFCEDVAVSVLVAEHGTPLYIYSTGTLCGHFQRLTAAFSPLDPTICFSVKSCQNIAILKRLHAWGSAFDVVSGGELRRAMETGVDPRRIVFAGVGKTDVEIREALAAGIGWFNVESEEELENVASIAASVGTTARVALRINPDVDPNTHLYTTTGTKETKFGVDLGRARRLFREFSGRPGLNLSGIHVHIGSPVCTIEPYVRAISRCLELIDQLQADGVSIDAINIGGGFGAHYDGSEAPPASAYAEQIVPLLRDRKLDVLMEPGRCIAANAGVLIAKTLYTKSSGKRRFVIVDAAITDLVRPALYGSFHFAWPVKPPRDMIPTRRSNDLSMPGLVPVDIVGPVCESGDFLAKDRMLPPLVRGDLICIFSTGAYGIVMSSQYNSRPRAAEVLVDGSTSRIIRRRETYDDLVAAERV